MNICIYMNIYYVYIYTYMYIKQDENSMMSWSTNCIIAIVAQPKFSTTLSPSSGFLEEGDRVVENFGCAIIVEIKFVDQDIIEFFYCFFIHTSTRGILQRYIYVYIYIHIQFNNLLNCFTSCVQG